MKKTTWRPCVLFVLLTEGTGALSAFLTRAGMQHYRAAVQQPPLSPPPIVFPIVWGVLYLLMGIGAGRVWLSPRGERRRQALGLFAVQLVFNFCWGLIFFGLRAFGFACLWLLALWGLIVLTLRAFRRADRWAARLQIPYLIWVTFAGYLNAGVWILNR